LLLALGAVVGLVGLAVDRATGPSRTALSEREKFELLKLRKMFMLDEAEDGLVLARRFGDKNAQVRFGIEVNRLRKKRAPI
jgi:hypothetical protein